MNPLLSAEWPSTVASSPLEASQAPKSGQAAVIASNPRGALKTKKRTAKPPSAIKPPELTGRYPVGELIVYFAYLGRKYPHGLPVTPDEFDTLERLAKNADDYLDNIAQQHGHHRTIPRFCPKRVSTANL
jgi:hypothetical protein